MKLRSIKNCASLGSLPEAYFETLSYYESLCWLYKYVNENVITAINDINDNVNYISDLLENLDIENIVDRLNLIDTKIAELTSHLSIINTNLTSSINDLQEQINSVQNGNVNIMNPTTGTIENISLVIDDIYDLFRTDALSAKEYDDLELTAQDFDSYQITAINFDLYGKTILV